MSCFLGHATVQVSGRGDVGLSDLLPGDRVLAKPNMYEPVLDSLHSIRSQPADFLNVVHSFGEFRASASHIVFANEVDVLMASIQVGDNLSVAGGKSMVLSVRRSVGSHAMFAPCTPSGTIVVDGVLASNYAGSSATWFSPHGAAHGIAFPLRMYHKLQRAFAFLLTDLHQKTSGEMVPVGLLSDLQSWVA